MPMLRLGMQVVTLCVTYPWRYARSGQDRTQSVKKRIPTGAWER